MEFVIKNKIGEFFFIENKENKIIAFISYYEDENNPSIIKSVKIANLYMKDEEENEENYKIKDKDDDILSDTLELMNDLLRKYKEVNYSASIYNKRAIKSYDFFFKRHKGNSENRVQDGNEINWKLIQE
jgi:hypothetical protein